MQRVSSNSTLFFKLFLPVFWIVFFGTFTIVVFAYQKEYAGNLPGIWLKWGALAFYILGLAVIYFTLWKLKRVEMSDEKIYITDYIKHYQYPIEDIESINNLEAGIIILSTITLKQAGSFGKKIHALFSPKLWEIYKTDNPAIENVIKK